MHWKIHPPRPSRFPSGGDFAPLGPWEISWASGGVFSDTSLLSAVYGFITFDSHKDKVNTTILRGSGMADINWLTDNFDCYSTKMQIRSERENSLTVESY